ncbi:MAG: penicillin acylase family protein [Chitinophagaceae bacterium]
MRKIPFAISIFSTIGLVWVLNKPWGSIPVLGKFFSPQHGFWQNAENTNLESTISLNFPELKDKVDVYFDERLVPHVFAQNESDLFFTQGYLHAKYRLWQMEFQTHAASGRLSEILGGGEKNIYVDFDRQMRRLGMVYGAKKAVEAADKEPGTKLACDAYTAGVNAYIGELTEANLPLEYKLVGYKPELWTNLKTALFLKYMSLDLSGAENDFEFTNAKSIFSKEDFDKIYPVVQDSLDPIVSRGTPFDVPARKPVLPKDVDSLYYHWKETVSIIQQKPDKDNGSNNWAVAGSKTQSGRPILCNDPHLSLNMPSLWFEMQLSTPQFNAYGASFPGAPCIIIGFNDSTAFGFTNAMRDVRDYYSIQFKDKSRKEYLFNGEWKASQLMIDTFMVKGQPAIHDTVAYTIFGPVMYDASFTGLGAKRTDGKNYAVRWKAHDASNELMIFYQLNHANNYNDYYNALQYLSCPGQNCLFASKAGDIAIWQQAEFPAKWKRQGDFVMPGIDSSYMWQGMIPRSENPHQVNPLRGFVSSANQLPVDSTYPYYIGGHHDLYRGSTINRYLSKMNGITPKNMEQLQTENYNLFAETALPVLLSHIDVASLNATEKEYFDIVRNWNKKNDPNEKGVAVFTTWFDSLEVGIWADEFANVPRPVDMPESFTTIEALLKDSAFKFIDDINTPDKETLKQVVTTAFKKAVPALAAADKEGLLSWSKFKDSGIQHLLRLAPFSKLHLITGGGLNVINATKKFHGPSWRMVVQLTDKTEAYGIYPGGQSGNPGSKYYDTFVDNWAAGQYYSLWVMRREEAADKRVIMKMSFGK